MVRLRHRQRTGRVRLPRGEAWEFPPSSGRSDCPSEVNWQYAMEILLTGERFGADRAKEIGLAGWVVPHERAHGRGASPSLVAWWRQPLWPLGPPRRWRFASQSLPSVEAIRFGETMRPGGDGPPGTRLRASGPPGKGGRPGGRVGEVAGADIPAQVNNSGRWPTIVSLPIPRRSPASSPPPGPGLSSIRCPGLPPGELDQSAADHP